MVIQVAHMRSAVIRVILHCRGSFFMIFFLQNIPLSDAVTDRVISERSTQFFSQCGNMYPDRIAEIVNAVVPYMVNKLFLTDGTPSVQKQIFEYAGLFSRESQRLPVGGGGTCLSIKGKRTAGQNDIVLRELSQCQTAYSRFQLLQVKRFCQIVISSCVKPLHFVGNLTASRKYQHLRVPV